MARPHCDTPLVNICGGHPKMQGHRGIQPYKLIFQERQLFIMQGKAPYLGTKGLYLQVTNPQPNALMSGTLT